MKKHEKHLFLTFFGVAGVNWSRFLLDFLEVTPKNVKNSEIHPVFGEKRTFLLRKLGEFTQQPGKPFFFVEI